MLVFWTFDGLGGKGYIDDIIIKKIILTILKTVFDKF